MKDVMIDLETMGNTLNAPIVQIGAIYFDRYTGEIGDVFYCNVDLKEEIKSGFIPDGSTIYWWLSQKTEAQESILKKPIYNYPTTYTYLNNFLKKARYIWSHATFDYVILMNHFNKLNIKPKFHYRSARDIRTLVDLAKIEYKEYERDGIYHNALDDCKHQVRYCVDCFNKLKGE